MTFEPSKLNETMKEADQKLRTEMEDLKKKLEANEQMDRLLTTQNEALQTKIEAVQTKIKVQLF